MAIALGGYVFAEGSVAAVEEHRETGGRDARAIVLRGVIAGAASLEALEAQLDAILAASSSGPGGVALSLRPGRVLTVRRMGYAREIERGQRVGRFTLKLEAEDPFEYGADTHVHAWSVSDSGSGFVCSTIGNVHAQPVIALSALGDIVSPSFSDGTRSIGFDGSLALGQVLTVDAAARRVYLDGEDATANSAGVFPQVQPGGTQLRFDAVYNASPAGSATVRYRDRWW